MKHLNPTLKPRSQNPPKPRLGCLASSPLHLQGLKELSELVKSYQGLRENEQRGAVLFFRVVGSRV